MGWNAQEAVRQRFAVTRLLGDMDKLYRELLQVKATCFSETQRMTMREYNESRTF
jgi:hypothetical protein